MSAPVEIIAAIAVIAYVIGRQVMGEALRGKRVVLLPAILAVIGIVELGGSKHPVGPVDVVLLLVGGVIAAGIGLAQGSAMRLESRNGGLWGQMPVASLWLWLGLIASRLVLTALAVGLDAKAAATTTTILLMLGINRLAQAAVIVLRARVDGIPFAPEKDGTSFLVGITNPSGVSGRRF